jgi:hypothetical protein
VLFAGGNTEKTDKTQEAVISARAAIGKMDAALEEPFFQGNGGKGIRLAVLAPTGKDMSNEDKWVPLYIQGLLNNNFGKFSAITLIDRQNLEQLLSEKQISNTSDFSDDDPINIGNLLNAQYVLMGSIEKISSGQYSLQLNITDLQTGVRNGKASSMKKGSLAQIEDGTLINEASEELLSGMGIILTDAGKQALIRGRANTAKAETSFAKGITAQASGASVEALFNYTQSVAFDPSQIEALSRLNMLSTTIRGGTISEQILTDLEARRSWLAAFRETVAFFNQHPPFEITFDPALVQEGETDYERETANLAMRIGLEPSIAGFSALNALLSGLENTGNREKWGFSGWPLLDLKPADSNAVVFAGGRSFSFRIDVALLNDKGKTIATNSIALNTGTMNFSTGDKNILAPEGSAGIVRFPNVNANNLTPILTIAITGINGISAETLNSTGYMKISAGNLDGKEQQIAAHEQAIQQQAELEQKRKQDALAQEQRELERNREAQAQYVRHAYRNTGSYVAAPIFIEWGEDSEQTSFGWEYASLTYSFIPFTSIGLGFYPVLSGGYGTVYENREFLLGMPLYAGLVIPLFGNYSGSGGFMLKAFSDFVYQINFYGDLNGMGFDVGLLFGWYSSGGAGLGFDLRYQRINYDGKYVNSIGIGFDAIIPSIYW